MLHGHTSLSDSPTLSVGPRWWAVHIVQLGPQNIVRGTKSFPGLSRAERIVKPHESSGQEGDQQTHFSDSGRVHGFVSKIKDINYQMDHQQDLFGEWWEKQQPQSESCSLTSDSIMDSEYRAMTLFWFLCKWLSACTRSGEFDRW